MVKTSASTDGPSLSVTGTVLTVVRDVRTGTETKLCPKNDIDGDANIWPISGAQVPDPRNHGGRKPHGIFSLAALAEKAEGKMWQK